MGKIEIFEWFSDIIAAVFFRIQDPDPQHFSKDMVRRLMNSAKEARAFDGNNYVPGVVGLNNIKEGLRLLRKPIFLFIFLLKV